MANACLRTVLVWRQSLTLSGRVEGRFRSHLRTSNPEDRHLGEVASKYAVFQLDAGSLRGTAFTPEDWKN
jgi:hypothetical protein